MQHLHDTPPEFTAFFVPLAKDSPMDSKYNKSKAGKGWFWSACLMNRSVGEMLVTVLTHFVYKYQQVRKIVLFWHVQVETHRTFGCTRCCQYPMSSADSQFGLCYKDEHCHIATCQSHLNCHKKRTVGSLLFFFL